MGSDNQARIEITGDASQANRVLDGFAAKVQQVSGSVRGSMGNIGEAVTSLQSKFLAFSAMVGAGAFTAGVKHQIELQDATRKSAQAAGMGVQAFDELAYAAKLADVDAEIFTKGMSKLGVAIFKAAEGDQDLKKLFADTLGVKIRAATGELRTTDDVLMDVAEKFAAMPDSAAKVAMAADLFGNKMGPGLIPFLNQGRSGIAELREELRRLKGVVTDESSAMAEQFNDNMTRMSVASEGFKMTVANKVLPTLVEFSNFFVEAAKKVGLLEAAWLSFGKVAARITGTDEIGQAQSRYKDAANEIERLQNIMVGLQNVLDRDPGNQLAVRRMANLTAKVAQLRDTAAAAQAEIQRLQTEALGPKVEPKTGKVVVDEDPSKAPQKESRVGAWANLLEQQKQVFAQGMLEQGKFMEWGHKEESLYWANLLERTDLSSAERVAIQAKYFAAERALRKQQSAANLAEQLVDIDSLRGKYAEQETAMASYVTRVGELYGLDSREYQEALAKQLAMKRDHTAKLREIDNIRREAAKADQLDVIADEERLADMRRSLGLITEAELIQIRARTIEQRRTIELDAKQAELEAAKGGISDPVEVERIEAQIAEIKRRYRGLAADNKGAGTKEAAKPFEAIFGASEQAISAGLESMVTRMRLTIGGLRDVMRSIGATMLQELVTKPIAAWLVGQARMVVLTWIFGKQKVAAEAVTQGEITAVQAAGSLKTIAMRAYEAAAGAYSAIAAIPYVGPVLAPVAAGVALAGVMAFAKSMFSAEGGFDIPGGVNPVVQTHAREMILPAKHADTIRMLGDMASGGGLGMGGDVKVEIKGQRLGDGQFITTEAELVSALKRLRRNFTI